jgi:hypothetical protein
MFLNARIDLRERAHRARDGAGRDLVTRGDEARAERWNSAWKPASFRPNVVGSAWMPWLRPMVGVILCSKARFFSAASTRSVSAISRSAARVQLHRKAGVEHVGRRHALVHEARVGADELGEMVRNAITSCFTSRSIASIFATSNVALPPRSQIVLAADFGMTPRSASASAACASISNQMRNFVSGDQIATISGRE